MAHIRWAAPASHTQSHPVLQATQLEITAGSNGRDYYDISLVVRNSRVFVFLLWNLSRAWLGLLVLQIDRLCASQPVLTCAWTRPTPKVGKLVHPIHALY